MEIESESKATVLLLSVDSSRFGSMVASMLTVSLVPVLLLLLVDEAELVSARISKWL